MVNRRDEVRNLLKMLPEEVIEKAGNRLIVLDSLDELYQHFGTAIASEIINNNKNNRPTKIILPIGPTEQYPILTNILVKQKVRLENSWFFFMDRYCDEMGNVLPSDHPLSFKKIIQERFLNPVIKIGLLKNHIIFPDASNIEKLEEIIEEIGGIDTCYGGIGIHGHLAFNEPELGISQSGPRKVKLNDFTRTINSLRSKTGGNLENFPTEAYTLGMKQILNSRKIRLYCRSDMQDWATTILRIALFAEPGDDYPVTFIRNHNDYIITTNWDTLRSPMVLI